MFVLVPRSLAIMKMPEASRCSRRSGPPYLFFIQRLAQMKPSIAARLQGTRATAR